MLAVLEDDIWPWWRKTTAEKPIGQPNIGSRSASHHSVEEPIGGVYVDLGLLI